jgi:hypothetical protein
MLPKWSHTIGTRTEKTECEMSSCDTQYAGTNRRDSSYVILISGESLFQRLTQAALLSPPLHQLSRKVLDDVLAERETVEDLIERLNHLIHIARQC